MWRACVRLLVRCGSGVNHADEIGDAELGVQE